MNQNRYGQEKGKPFIKPDYPEKMGVKVVDESGKIVKGAIVKLYPFSRGKIENRVVMEGKSDKNGEFIFPENPYQVKDGERARWNPLFLAEVEYKGAKEYFWMPVNEPHLFVFEHKGEPLYWNVTVKK